jgi:hypothetical protein
MAQRGEHGHDCGQEHGREQERSTEQGHHGPGRPPARLDPGRVRGQRPLLATGASREVSRERGRGLPYRRGAQRGQPGRGQTATVVQ